MRNALYRVYRPQNFDEVEGQVHVATTLRNAAKEGMFAHAYLFTGTRGTGKTTMARIVAKAINCASLLPDGNPCNVCEFCLGATQGKLVDIIEIDAASNNSVDQMRDLTERARFQPVQAQKKIYIIDEVHMLSSSAFNALLKTLEEPPSHVHFILATTEQHKILPTIVSRCQVFHFLPLSEQEIIARLTLVSGQEKLDISPEAIAAVAKHARGGMRDALSILERLAAVPGTIDAAMVHDILGSAASEQFTTLAQAVIDADVQKALGILREAQSRGAAPDKFIRGFKNALRDLLIEEAMTKGVKAETRRLMDITERLENSLVHVKYADVPWLHCELAILHACDTEAPVAAPAPKKAAPTPKVQAVATPVPTPTPAPKAAPAPKMEAPKDEAPDPVKRLQKEWSSFGFKVQSSVVRTALKSTKVSGVENEELVLICTSSVQFVHLSLEENVTLIRQALETHFGIQMPLSIRLAAGEPAPAPAPKAEPAPQIASTPEDDIMKVADLFGGTITG